MRLDEMIVDQMKIWQEECSSISNVHYSRLLHGVAIPNKFDELDLASAIKMLVSSGRIDQPFWAYYRLCEDKGGAK